MDSNDYLKLGPLARRDADRAEEARGVEIALRYEALRDVDEEAANALFELRAPEV